MVEVNKMPETGKFVAVWTHGGAIWADTFEANGDGRIMRFDHGDAGFTDPIDRDSVEEKSDVRYFIVE